MGIELTVPVVDLKIKPVTFVIELFVVLEHGRRANLCLARFTQTRGAASARSSILSKTSAGLAACWLRMRRRRLR
jgi:hypothetical protein